MPWSQKTPEMNELETGEKSLKFWTPNFENQQSYSILKIIKKGLKKSEKNRTYSSLPGGATHIFSILKQTIPCAYPDIEGFSFLDI